MSLKEGKWPIQGSEGLTLSEKLCLRAVLIVLSGCPDAQLPHPGKPTALGEADPAVTGTQTDLPATGSLGVHIPPPRTHCVPPCPVREIQGPSLVREPSLHHLTMPVRSQGPSCEFPSCPNCRPPLLVHRGTQHPHTWDFLREAEAWAQHGRVGIWKRSPDTCPIQLRTHP